MTGKAEEKSGVSFEAMNLQVGTRLQLITFGPGKNEYYSSLIGFDPGRYILVKMPQGNGFHAPLKLAERVDIRIFTGVCIYSFPSCVEHIYLTPQNFVELAFPDTIRMMPLRKDIRIATRIPVRVWNVNGKTLEEAFAATALDVSLTGLMLRSNVNLGKVGDKIGLSFAIRNTATGENTTIDAMVIIRNSSKDEKNTFRHGVFFQELRPFHRATLESFINESSPPGQHATLA